MNDSHPTRSPEDDAIEERAAEWLARRDDEFAAGDEAEFARWCSADPRHAAAVERLETVWCTLHQLQGYRPAARAHPDRDLLAPQRHARVVRFPTFGSLLAGAAAAILLVVLLWPQAQPAEGDRVAASPHSYITTAGGYQRLTLPDGSVVELNANSELRVRYTVAERRTTLVRGEAHFVVASNKQRPFLVEADGLGVRAVGTAFNVRRHDAGIEVVVTAGSVQFDRAGEIVPIVSDGTPVLQAGWRATFETATDAAPQVEKMELAAMRRALAWQGSRLVFIEMPLREVVEQFNRHNDLQLSLADPELEDVPVGGSFGAENVESFVRLLSSNGDVVAERAADNRIILRKPAAKAAPISTSP